MFIIFFYFVSAQKIMVVLHVLMLLGLFHFKLVLVTIEIVPYCSLVTCFSFLFVRCQVSCLFSMVLVTKLAL